MKIQKNMRRHKARESYLVASSCNYTAGSIALPQRLLTLQESAKCSSNLPLCLETGLREESLESSRCEHLDDWSKPILFSMARLDKVKNVTRLVEAFAKCSKLRELVNLLVAGYNDVKKSKDKGHCRDRVSDG
ncbi:unnamed protein product [Urochloa humidicola]